MRHTFRDYFKADLHVVDAPRPVPLGARPASPIRRRSGSIIGHVFIDVFKDEAKSHPGREVPRPGHALPRRDRERRRRPTARPRRSRLHHNVGGLPAELGFELIEPLRDLFKDEVRRLGLELGPAGRNRLAAPVPRPRPGGALPRRSDRRAARRRSARPTRSSSTSCKQAGWYRKTAQAFAVLLPVQSVGVMGDGRTYENAVACGACRPTTS